LGRASQSGAFQDANNRDIYEPAFRAALGKVAAERTQTADDYMPSAGHPAYMANRRPVIHRDSGAEAGEERSVGPAARSLAELQAYLFDAGKRGSAATALKDYFTLSIVGKREHANYKPQNITYQIKEGAFEFSYDYSAEAEAVPGGGRPAAAPFATMVVAHRCTAHTSSPTGSRAQVMGLRAT